MGLRENEMWRNRLKKLRQIFQNFCDKVNDKQGNGEGCGKSVGSKEQEGKTERGIRKVAICFTVVVWDLIQLFKMETITACMYVDKNNPVEMEYWWWRERGYFRKIFFSRVYSI